MLDADADPAPLVQAFHQILLWPLHLLQPAGARGRGHWEVLKADPSGHWREVDDEFCDDHAAFQERHYREFVTFLPYVQRLFYGEGGRRSTGGAGPSPVKVFRRRDIAGVRVTFPHGSAPVTLTVKHLDLYFFHDVDLAILVVEVQGADLPLATVQELLHRFGRAFPAGWTERGDGLNCPRKVEWLGPDGTVLSVSDYEDRAAYLGAVARDKASLLSAHWRHVLAPLVPDASAEDGALRFRQLESYRMPLMAYLAVDGLEHVTRADYVRLCYTTSAGDRDTLPYSRRHLETFESAYCYDKYFDDTQFDNGLSVRILCHDHSFLMVGDAGQRFFTDAERGLLGQFRHQYFMLGLLVHMHKGALLLVQDRMVQAVTQLDTDSPESVQVFRREIRLLLESFLRFSHRYWFQEVSDQVQPRNVFRILRNHIGTERLYADVRDELKDMSAYLDSDLLRRQSMTFLRLTVVTTVGLIWTSATGFLGMNIFSEASQPLWVKALYVLGVTFGFTALTVYTLAKSQRMANFMEAVTNERLALSHKTRTLFHIWRPRQ